MVRGDGAFDGLTLGFGNRLTGVVDAMGRQRPAVILAALDDVDFIAALRAVFVFPQRAVPRVERRALRIALPVGPDLRAHVGLADKGVVLGHSAIRVDSHHFTLQLVEVLGGRAVVVFPQGHEQIAVAIKHQPRAKMVAHRELGFLTQDHLEILERRHIVGEPAAAHRRAGLAALTATFGIGQIDHPVLLEVGRQRHVEQSTLPLGPDRGYAIERCGQLAFGGHQSQVAGPFGHQHAFAIRQECQGPGVLQPRHDGGDLKGAIFAFHRLGRCGKHRDSGADQYAGTEGCQQAFTQHAGFLF
ncbi:hypothetical protein D3C84_403630 [compost metagenome]